MGSENFVYHLQDKARIELAAICKQLNYSFYEPMSNEEIKKWGKILGKDEEGLYNKPEMIWPDLNMPHFDGYGSSDTYFHMLYSKSLEDLKTLWGKQEGTCFFSICRECLEKVDPEFEKEIRKNNW